MAGVHNLLVGAGGRLQVVINITANETNYVFNTAKVTGYVEGQTDAIFNISSGVVLSADSTAAYGGSVDTSWNSGDTVRINNSGTIVGMGGAGGKGFAGGAPAPAGGPAFIAQRAVTLNNTGTIAGGGGGGGGGQAVDGEGGFYYGGNGGGGGRSSNFNSAAGAGGTGQTTVAFNGNAGAPGTFAAAGLGSTAVSNAGIRVGAGGNGGGWGAAGANGGNKTEPEFAPFGSAYAGGAGGAAIAGNANISYIATGTRLGAIA